MNSRRGRPAPYKGRAVQKSVTLDPELLERLHKYTNGNLSQTLNELLARYVERKEAEDAINRMAEIVGVEFDADTDAEVDKEIDELLVRAAEARQENERRRRGLSA